MDSFITNCKKKLLHLEAIKSRIRIAINPDFSKEIWIFFPKILFLFLNSFLYVPTTYRRGFVHYTMGQLKAVAESFYKLKLEIEVMDQEVKFDTIHVSFKLTFDNKVTDRTNSG